MSEFDIIEDSSRQNLKEVPQKILQMYNLKMLYLQENFLKKLPDDFFLKLPNLSWLDLRSNHLEKIPESIAHHQHLESLLLTDNKIETLPNEMGLVPKLKVVQLANNPICYPCKEVISKGTRSVLTFLKNQYEKELNPTEEIVKESEETREERELREEEEVRIVENYQECPLKGSISSSLTVKRLSRDTNNEEKPVHVVAKSDEKIFIKSYFNDDEDFAKTTQTGDYAVISKASLKQDWMDRLKVLLEEQEKILQQERNLKALSSWRHKRKNEPLKQIDREENNCPYGTYPEYDSLLSREELARQIDRLIEHSKHQPRQENIEKLINDLVSELKEMETSYDGFKSPRSEIEAAGSEIMKIMEVHKKLLKLQEMNMARP